MGILWLFS